MGTTSCPWLFVPCHQFTSIGYAETEITTGGQRDEIGRRRRNIGLAGFIRAPCKDVSLEPNARSCVLPVATAITLLKSAGTLLSPPPTYQKPGPFHLSAGPCCVLPQQPEQRSDPNWSEIAVVRTAERAQVATEPSRNSATRYGLCRGNFQHITNPCRHAGLPRVFNPPRQRARASPALRH